MAGAAVEHRARPMAVRAEVAAMIVRGRWARPDARSWPATHLGSDPHCLAPLDLDDDRLAAVVGCHALASGVPAALSRL